MSHQKPKKIKKIKASIKKIWSFSMAFIFFLVCFFFDINFISANIISKFDDNYLLKNYDFNLPSEYSSTSQGLVTSVKTQKNQGPCWAFGIIAALESNYLKQNNLKVNNNWEIDFSEMNMIFNLNKGASLNNLYEFDFEKSGNNEMASAYFASGRGPVFEKDDFYNENYLPRDQINNLNKPLAKYIKKMIYIPNPDRFDDLSLKNHRELIKKYIFDNGSVASDIFFDENFLDSSGKSYFYNSYSDKINHTVAIIGWDDNYSRENFNKNNLPDSNGAFIIKNSWGPDKHDNGFFYLSYDDKFAGFNSLVMQNIVEPDDKFNFNNIYQHDYFGMTHAIKKSLLEDKNNIACVFDLKSNKEALTDIGVFIASNNTNCKFFLLELDKDNNISGYSDFLCEENFEFPGYYVISLPNKILLDKKKFGVAVNLTGDDLFIACEKKIYDYSSKAVGNPNQNFYGDEYGFKDLYNKIDGVTNFCIKAFTEKNISGAENIYYKKIKPKPEPIDLNKDKQENLEQNLVSPVLNTDHKIDNNKKNKSGALEFIIILLPFIGLCADYYLRTKTKL